MKTFDEWWREEIDKCLIPPAPERMAKLAWEAATKEKEAPSSGPFSDGLCPANWEMITFEMGKVTLTGLGLYEYELMDKDKARKLRDELQEAIVYLNCIGA